MWKWVEGERKTGNGGGEPQPKPKPMPKAEQSKTMPQRNYLLRDATALKSFSGINVLADTLPHLHPGPVVIPVPIPTGARVQKGAPLIHKESISHP